MSRRASALLLAVVWTISLCSGRALADGPATTPPAATPPGTTPAGTTPAATPDPAAAAAAKARGDDALIGGRPAEALEAYRAAYAMRPDAAVVYNIGRAHQALGDYPAALERFEQFEATAPPETRARVPGLAALLAEVRGKVATVVVAVDVADATITIDGKPVGRSPLSKSIRLPAGSGTVLVEKEGYFPFQRSIELPGGKITPVNVTLASKLTRGVVVVKSPVAGARVALDGKDEGTVPTELYAAPGSHRIDLSREGYRPLRTEVALAAGEQRVLDLPMQAEAPITKKWWFWTGIAVVAAGVAVTVVALTTERDPDAGSVQPGRIDAGSFRF